MASGSVAAISRGMRLGVLPAVLVCSGCVTLPAYRMPNLLVQSSWSTDATGGEEQPLPVSWWQLLQDPAVDGLVELALSGNPSLIDSIARVDEARANLGIERSARLPSVIAQATSSRASQLDTSRLPDAPVSLASSASAGLNVRWELDLFGRVRSSTEAAHRRLDARDAEAQGVRLDLAAEVAANVLALHACHHSLSSQHEDVASRERVLELTRGRVSSGSVAPAEEARAQSNLSLSRATVASVKESCDRLVNALAALTARPAHQVREFVGASTRTASPSNAVSFASAPETRLALPATVLLHHPSVVSAEREVAASWSDISAAKADRLPRLDIAALLSGQWLRFGGSSFDYTSRLLSVGAAVPLFDGGRRKAAVNASEARYRAATARLSLAVQSAWRDVEDALAAIESSKSRLASASESVNASRRLLTASESQWQAGSVSLFELEDARRLFAEAQNNQVTAARDRAQAWVALIRASGSVSTISQSTPNGIDESALR